MRCEEEGWDMSYESYCQDQGIDCARRARLARSSEVATYWRSLGLRWLRIAEQAHIAGGASGPASDEGETSSFIFPAWTWNAKRDRPRSMRTRKAYRGSSRLLPRNARHNARIAGALDVALLLGQRGH